MRSASQLGSWFLGWAFTAVLAGHAPAQVVETNHQFRVETTDRKPGPVMDAETIRAGLKSLDRALDIKAEAHVAGMAGPAARGRRPVDEGPDLAVRPEAGRAGLRLAELRRGGRVR